MKFNEASDRYSASRSVWLSVLYINVCPAANPEGNKIMTFNADLISDLLISEKTLMTSIRPIKRHIFHNMRVIN